MEKTKQTIDLGKLDLRVRLWLAFALWKLRRGDLALTVFEGKIVDAIDLTLTLNKSNEPFVIKFLKAAKERGILNRISARSH